MLGYLSIQRRGSGLFFFKSLSVKEMFTYYRELTFQLYLSHSSPPQAQWNEVRSLKRSVEFMAVSYRLWLAMPELSDYLYAPVVS